VGKASETNCREPMEVGRVTPCAPRLPPAGAKFPWCRLPDPLPIKTLVEFPAQTSEFELNEVLVSTFYIYSPGLNFFT